MQNLLVAVIFSALLPEYDKITVIRMPRKMNQTFVLRFTGDFLVNLLYFMLVRRNQLKLLKVN